MHLKLPYFQLSSPRKRGSRQKLLQLDPRFRGDDKKRDGNKTLFFSVCCWIAALIGGNHLPSPALADIRIENPWVRASTGPNAALFMTIVNTAETPEKLTSAHIDACAHAELHTHVEENGVFRMREVEFIDIPAGGSKDLKPGGHHVMLMKIHSPLQEGGEVPVTLSFEKGEPVAFIAPVKGMGGECCHK